MTNTRLLFILLSMCVSLGTHAAVPSNIIITSYESTYELMPDKSQTTITAIKNKIKANYVATRVPGSAITYARYNDDITVTKAKCKGSKPIYTNTISQNIFFDDSRICIIPVDLPKVNQEVEATFELINKRPDKEPLIFVGDIYPIKNYCVSLAMPASFKDRYDIFADNLPDGITITRAISEDNKIYTITLTASELPALMTDADMAPGRYTYPTVQLKGHFKTLDDLYPFMHKYISIPDPNINEVYDMARRITDNHNDPYEKITAIFRWVNENIRYIAIENGDLGLIPDHASNVLRKKYGDCKGSANLIKHMLIGAGIDGRIVWIGTDAIPYEWTERPAYSTANHMIAAAILPEDSILYLDGTVGLADCGFYSQSIQGKQTLIEDGDKYIVDRVPVLPPSASSNTISCQVSIDGTRLQTRYHQEISGEYKAGLLNSYRWSDGESRQKIFQRFIRQHVAGCHVDSVTVTNGAPDNGPMYLDATMYVDNRITTASNKSYINLDICPEFKKLTFDMKNRRYPGWIDAPQSIERNYTITQLDESYKITTPDDISISNEWFDAQLTHHRHDDMLDVRLKVSFLKKFIPFSSLDRFNDDVKILNRQLAKKIVIE